MTGPNLRAVHLSDAADGTPLWGCDHVAADGNPWALCGCGHVEASDARVCALETLDGLGRAAMLTHKHHLGDDATTWDELTHAERDGYRMAGLAGRRGAVIR